MILQERAKKWGSIGGGAFGLEGWSSNVHMDPVDVFAEVNVSGDEETGDGTGWTVHRAKVGVLHVSHNRFQVGEMEVRCIGKGVNNVSTAATSLDDGGFSLFLVAEDGGMDFTGSVGLSAGQSSQVDDGVGLEGVLGIIDSVSQNQTSFRIRVGNLDRLSA